VFLDCFTLIMRFPPSAGFKAFSIKTTNSVDKAVMTCIFSLRTLRSQTIGLTSARGDTVGTSTVKWRRWHNYQRRDPQSRPRATSRVRWRHSTGFSRNREESTLHLGRLLRSTLSAPRGSGVNGRTGVSMSLVQASHPGLWLSTQGSSWVC